MSVDTCSNCDEPFGWEVGWDDPPEGEGHIEVAWNPADEPSFVVGAARHYCSVPCLLQDIDELPFSPTPDEIADIVDTGYGGGSRD